MSLVNRSIKSFDSDGNYTETFRDIEWDEIKKERQRLLKITDLWYLKDRWDQLSTAHKGKLNTYRQALRDLPQIHPTANDAADNWPEPEDWF